MAERLKKLTYRESFWVFIFLAPSILGFLVFVLYPTVDSLYLSFTKWDFINKPEFIGAANYTKMFADSTFLKVFRNTLVYTLVTVPLLIVIPLILAVALNQKIWGMRFFRAVYFLPVIASTVAISLIWQWMFNADFGIVNFVISWFGVRGPNWLTDKHFALAAVMITSIWKNVGYNMMLFLAGLQGIPAVYYEAASLEKINGWQRFRYLTFPLLNSTTLFVTVITIINSFQVFDQVVIMTGGGPSKHSSVLVHYIYQNAFKFYDMGYACALGWILAIFIFLLTMAQFGLSRKNSED